jgi:hypothetical protein
MVPVTSVTTTTMEAGASSSDLREEGPLSKKAYTRVCLPPSAWYICVCEAMCLLYDSSVLSSFLFSKRVILRWQEAYLADSELLKVNHAPDLRVVDAEGDDIGVGPAGVGIDGGWSRPYQG